MALAGLFVSAAVQLPARRRDAAALRVVGGVPRSSVMVAVVRELAIVLGSAEGALRETDTRALAAISPVRLVVLALLAAAVFGGVALFNASMTVRGARGSTLRESAR